jgi:hypothetical protein
MARQDFFVGKNKHFLQILALSLIVLGLSAGVALVSSRTALFVTPQASTVTKTTPKLTPKPTPCVSTAKYHCPVKP